MRSGDDKGQLFFVKAELQRGAAQLATVTAVPELGQQAAAQRRRGGHFLALGDK